jgi:hypothetical protein
LISLLFTIIMIVVMRWQGLELNSPRSSRGLIDLEFAKTSERLYQLQLFWNTEVVLKNIYIDFLFIMAYTWFLVTACKTVNNRQSNIFSSLAISAGAFDVLENFLMIMVLNGRFNPSVLEIVYYCAAIKFLLAGIVLLYVILSLFGLFKSKPAD